jgi:hypothetical protein
VRKDTSIRKFASNKSKLFKKIDGSNAIEINRTSSNVVQSKASTCRVSLPQGGKHKSKCSIVNDDDDDDRCSVASAILEEDICFKCGMSSLNEPSWSDLILCDICDGEFHLACAGLETAPRSGWRCQRCNQEYFFFRKLKYEVLPYFKVLCTTVPKCTVMVTIFFFRRLREAARFFRSVTALRNRSK